MYRDQRLENLYIIHLTVLINADVTPGNPARDVQVGGHIEPAFVTGGQKTVEPRHLVRVERQCVRTSLHAAVVVMVDTHAVIAQAHQAVRELVGLLLRREVGRAAEVDAVEALCDAGFALKLEVRADRLEPPVLAGRRIGETHAGEIERGFWDNLFFVRECHPLRPRFQHHRLGVFKGERRVRFEREPDLKRLADRIEPRATGDDADAKYIAPATAVLDQNRGRFIERKDKTLRGRRRHLDLQFFDFAAEERKCTFLLGEDARLLVSPPASADCLLCGEAGVDKEAVQFKRGLRREGVVRVDRTISGRHHLHLSGNLLFVRKLQGACACAVLLIGEREAGGGDTTLPALCEETAFQFECGFAECQGSAHAEHCFAAETRRRQHSHQTGHKY